MKCKLLLLITVLTIVYGNLTAQSVISSFPLDEGNDLLVDSVGNNTLKNINGVQTTTGFSGNGAALFSGDSTYLESDSVNLFEQDASIAIEGIIKLDNDVNLSTMTVAGQWAGGENNLWRVNAVWVDSIGKSDIRFAQRQLNNFEFFHSSAPGFLDVEDRLYLENDIDYYFAVSHENRVPNDGDTLTFYVKDLTNNGPLRKVRYYRLFGIFDTPEKTKTPIRIGRSGDDLFQFRGEIDYVRILSAPNGTPALDENNLLLNSLDLSSDVLVSEITVSSAEGNTITVENTSQMSATVLPENATDPTFDWSVVNGTGEATIDQNGLLTSVSEGIVTVEAIANDASGVKGELEITIEAKPDVLVTEISVSSANGINIVLGQTSQMSAVVLPADATDATFTWNVVNGSGEATIDETGLLTTISAGLVTVEAIANDASGVKGTLEINIQTEAVLVTEITISSAEGNTISVGQSSQMSAVVSPSDASDQSFTWSVTNGTGEATIDDGGLLTTVSVGTVTVEATASDASGVVGTLQITIEEVLVTEITVSSAEGTSIAIGQTSQMSAVVLPSDATDATFTWGVVNGTGEATIDQNGLLTAVAAGTITVEATANDASGITGTLDVTIEDILVSEITITSAEGITITEGETSQMSAVVLPQDATDATFTWGVVNGTGEATIDQKGLLTAVSEGTVSVEATANDASGVKGTLELTIEPDVILVTSITVTSASGNTITEGQTLQMSAAVLPENSTDATVTWGVVNGTGEAIIDANGLLTAVAAGLVTVEATANDASGVKGAFEIIVNEVLVTEIVVNSAEGTTVIVGGTSQMNATVLPQNANDLSFEWSVMNGTGEATIDQMGLFTATSVGSVTVQATANDGSAVAGSLEITIDPLPLSIAEGNEIRVYPNPVTNKLFIDNYRFGTIEMIDSSGKRFGKEVIAGQVNISDMRDGIYLINLLDKNEMIRIIITH